MQPTAMKAELMELYEKNLATVNAWLDLRGTKVERWKARMPLITDDFVFSRDLYDADGTLGGFPKAYFEPYLAMESVEEPNSRWGFFDAEVYASVKNPNRFVAQCVYREESMETGGLYTFYFEMRDGKIRALQEYGEPDIPGRVFADGMRYRPFSPEECERNLAAQHAAHPEPEDDLVKE